MCLQNSWCSSWWTEFTGEDRPGYQKSGSVEEDQAEHCECNSVTVSQFLLWPESSCRNADLRGCLVLFPLQEGMLELEAKI